jgi:hypothetical protein
MCFCGSHDIGTVSSSRPGSICPHRPLRLCDIVTHLSVTMSSHNLQNASPVENRSRPGSGRAGAVGVSPTCRLIRETGAVVTVPRPPRPRRGGAQAFLRPIADRDRPRVGQHPHPIWRRISCVTPSANGWCRHAKSRPALKRTVRPAGEPLGLSPPAAPREILLLDAVLVNAYNSVDAVGLQPLHPAAPSATRRVHPASSQPVRPRRRHEAAARRSGLTPARSWSAPHRGQTCWWRSGIAVGT